MSDMTKEELLLILRRWENFINVWSEGITNDDWRAMKQLKQIVETHFEGIQPWLDTLLNRCHELELVCARLEERLEGYE